MLAELRAKGRERVLFRSLSGQETMTAFQAAEVVTGREIRADGLVARIDQIFISNILQQEGVAGKEPLWRSGSYGFSGHGKGGFLLARWSAADSPVLFYRGEVVNPGDLKPGGH